MNRDDDGSVIDAIFAVQYIDKEKKKELEYSRALKRALETRTKYTRKCCICRAAESLPPGRTTTK